MRRLIRALLAGAIAICAGASLAQPFSSRPITIIVPLDPGSALDILARAMLKPFSERMGGASVLVENRPGANFIIAASACARAKPDGYTVCLLPRDSISILPYEGPVPYDAQKDFAPIANLAWLRSVLLTHLALPVGNFQELVAYSRKNPDTLNYTAFGSAQLAMEWFKKQAGIHATFVPFKSAPAAVQAFLGGEVQVYYSALSAPGMMGLIKAGKVRAHMVPGETRNPLLPEVPSAIELGLPSFTILAWQGMFAPAGTARDAIARMSEAFVGVVKTAEFRDRNMLPFGFDPIGMPHDEFARFLLRDVKEGAELVKIVGARTR